MHTFPIQPPERSPDYISAKCPKTKKGPSRYWFKEFLLEPSPGVPLLIISEHKGDLVWDWSGIGENDCIIKFNTELQKAYKKYLSDT